MQKARLPYLVWIAWTIASTLAILVGGHIGDEIAVYFYPPQPPAVFSTFGGRSGMEFPIGLVTILMCLGITQWCVLLYVLRHAWRWLLATVSASLPFLIGDFVLGGAGLISFFSVFFVAGLVLGVCQ